VGMASQRLSVKQNNFLRQHRYIIKKLAYSNFKDKKTILENSPPELFKVLKLIFKLLADERLSLSKPQLKKLKKHRSWIHSTSKLKEKQIKTKLIRHRKGILNKILKTVSSALGKVFAIA
jgi:nitric oxide reductase activation protein